MTPNWVLQVLWYGAGVAGSGAVWYFLTERDYPAVVFAAADCRVDESV
jgi:hypothetical protein